MRLAKIRNERYGSIMKDATIQSPRSWPAAQVEMWQVGDLVPYTKNARQHPPEQIDQIAASMERFGVHHPDAGGRGRHDHRGPRPADGRRAAGAGSNFGKQKFLLRRAVALGIAQT